MTKQEKEFIEQLKDDLCEGTGLTKEELFSAEVLDKVLGEIQDG